MNPSIEAGTRKMFSLVHALPDQLVASGRLEGLSAIQRPAEGFNRIILCGMGGSAIAGDLVQPLLTCGRVPLVVWRDYGLPHWAGPGDLVLCSSYSGDTEETLSGAREAKKRGIPRLAVTSGGNLAAMASSEGFGAVILPGGYPPRASLGLGLGAVVRMLGRLGLVPAADEVVEKAAATLNKFSEARMSSDQEDPEGNLPAAQLAALLAGRIPVIYTAGQGALAAGVRLRAQLNENSKVPAMLASFPELDHNDLVGWDLPPADRDRFVLLILRGKSENDRLDSRVELTRQLLDKEFFAIHEISSRTAGILDHTLSLVQYGDYLSCHLAQARKVDPMPVDRITKLKEALGKPE